jgi:hypothetical protein
MLPALMIRNASHDTSLATDPNISTRQIYGVATTIQTGPCLGRGDSPWAGPALAATSTSNLFFIQGILLINFERNKKLNMVNILTFPPSFLSDCIW